MNSFFFQEVKLVNWYVGWNWTDYWQLRRKAIIKGKAAFLI